MSITIHKQLSGVAAVRSPSSADSPASARGHPRGSSAPGTPTEASRDHPAREIGPMIQSALAVDDSKAPAPSEQAVEQANALSESVLRSSRRSVEFDRDAGSGRIVMTIREDDNGEITERQIPPDEFIRVVRKLEALAQGEAPAGGFVDFKA